MANYFLVPGGGLDFSNEVPVLDRPSIERVGRVAELYQERPQLFESMGSMVICAGRHQTLPDGTPEIDDVYCEGAQMAQLLIDLDLPPAIVRAETTSTSTFTNVMNALGLIGQGNISFDSPLHIVSHPNHAKRVVLSARKLGVAHHFIDVMPVQKVDNASYERILRLIAKTSFGFTHSPEKLLERDQRLEDLHDRLTRGVQQARNIAKTLLHMPEKSGILES